MPIGGANGAPGNKSNCAGALPALYGSLYFAFSDQLSPPPLRCVVGPLAQGILSARRTATGRTYAAGASSSDFQPATNPISSLAG